MMDVRLPRAALPPALDIQSVCGSGLGGWGAPCTHTTCTQAATTPIHAPLVTVHILPCLWCAELVNLVACLRCAHVAACGGTCHRRAHSGTGRPQLHLAPLHGALVSGDHCPVRGVCWCACSSHMQQQTQYAAVAVCRSTALSAKSDKATQSTYGHVAKPPPRQTEAPLAGADSLRDHAMQAEREA
jgi:hypothetical protein